MKSTQKGVNKVPRVNAQNRARKTTASSTKAQRGTAGHPHGDPSHTSSGGYFNTIPPPRQTTTSYQSYQQPSEFGRRTTSGQRQRAEESGTHQRRSFTSSQDYGATRENDISLERAPTRRHHRVEPETAAHMNAIRYILNKRSLYAAPPPPSEEQYGKPWNNNGMDELHFLRNERLREATRKAQEEEMLRQHLQRVTNQLRVHAAPVAAAAGKSLASPPVSSSLLDELGGIVTVTGAMVHPLSDITGDGALSGRRLSVTSRHHDDAGEHTPMQRRNYARRMSIRADEIESSLADAALSFSQSRGRHQQYHYQHDLPMSTTATAAASGAALTPALSALSGRSYLGEDNHTAAAAAASAFGGSRTPVIQFTTPSDHRAMPGFTLNAPDAYAGDDSTVTGLPPPMISGMPTTGQQQQPRNRRRHSVVASTVLDEVHRLPQEGDHASSSAVSPANQQQHATPAATRQQRRRSVSLADRHTSLETVEHAANKVVEDVTDQEHHGGLLSAASSPHDGIALRTTPTRRPSVNYNAIMGVPETLDQLRTTTDDAESHERCLDTAATAIREQQHYKPHQFSLNEM